MLHSGSKAPTVGIKEAIRGTFPHPFAEILSVGKKDLGQEKETQKVAETKKQIILYRTVCSFVQGKIKRIKAHLNIKLREKL